MQNEHDKWYAIALKRLLCNGNNGIVKPLCFFSYTYNVIGDFSLTSASIDVIRLAVSNFNWGDPICFQGYLCTSDVMGVSSVMLASFNVVGLSVSNFSWGYPICSQGLLCTPAVDCSSICLLRKLATSFACSVECFELKQFQNKIILA